VLWGSLAVQTLLHLVCCTLPTNSVQVFQVGSTFWVRWNPKISLCMGEQGDEARDSAFRSAFRWITEQEAAGYWSIVVTRAIWDSRWTTIHIGGVPFYTNAKSQGNRHARGNWIKGAYTIASTGLGKITVWTNYYTEKQWSGFWWKTNGGYWPQHGQGGCPRCPSSSGTSPGCWKQGWVPEYTDWNWWEQWVFGLGWLGSSKSL